jgi:REP element-mobilizing transposase RayT
VAVEKRQGAKLPHWTADNATYSVTFRLADSIPPAAAAKLSDELSGIEKLAQRGVPLPLEELIRLHRLRDEAIDRLLNVGHGECLFKDDRLAGVVAGALQHFDGTRYRLEAWCVMPNHVHAVFTPVGGHTLAKVLHSWKSFTAHDINKKLGRSGHLWQTESYDHLIRDNADLMHHVFYVRENPVKAGLVDWPWVG